MAAFMLARGSPQKSGQTLFYVQAVDQPLTLLQRAAQEDLYHLRAIENTKHSDN